MNTPPLHIISSMATKKLLGEMAALFEQAHPGVTIKLESVGGVDAAKRVQAGETFDVVVLASDAIDRLIEGGHVRSGSRVDIVRSEVALAVQHGTPHPDISTEGAIRTAVLAAPSLSYSTGPSGVQLAALFETWGIADVVKNKLIVPPPGVPVGSLIATGEASLGFQQLSELMHIPGLDVLGVMPEPVRIDTIFSGGLASTSSRAESVTRLLEFMASEQVTALKRENGMAKV